MLESDKYLKERESLLRIIKVELFPEMNDDSSLSTPSGNLRIEGLQIVNDKLVFSNILEGFIFIMRSSNAKICRATAQYIFRAFKKRAAFLKTLHNNPGNVN